MSRTTLRRLVPTLLITITLTACASDDATVETPSSPTATTSAAATSTPSTTEPAPTESATTEPTVAATFPVEVEHDGGSTTLEAEPQAIVSLSPTATEMLFAIGAGDQVVAADEFSNFPDEAPDTDLSGFQPNVEAVLSYEPDLVIMSGDANDVVASLAEVDVPVLLHGSATELDDTYRQIASLGVATGHAEEAAEVNDDIRTQLDEIADPTAGDGLTYYHELSPELYTATSTTFIGQVYGLFGLDNIADDADEDGTGYPQLSSEYVVDADPDLVFLSCTTFCGMTAEDFGTRDGYEEVDAVEDGAVVELDEDISSRWGPRVVDFARDIAAELESETGERG